MKKAHRLLIALFLLISIFQSQHFESFDTGILTLTPTPYTTQSTTYRNFSCTSSPSTLSINGFFTFSILSFNYFIKQAFCLKPTKNLTSLATIVSCSPNVYRLAYMFFDKGPNIFVHYGERVYDQGKNSSDLVDLTKWMGEVKFPLKSLVKNSNSQQYEVAVESFISGVSLFKDTSTGSVPVLNGFGKVKLQAVYFNITVDNETKLWVPVGVRIATSSTVEKVSFYCLILIKQMISMNMNFKIISLNNTSGITHLGYFAGINEISFYLPTNNGSSSEEVSLKIDYNYKPSNSSMIFKRFSPDKLFSYNKGANLNVKYTRLTEIFYRRCFNNTVYHTYPPELPKQGRFYKISPASNADLVWQVTSEGKIKLGKWANIQSQKFYLLYQVVDRMNQAMLFNVLTNKTVRTQLSKVNDTLQMGQANESDLKSSWLLKYTTIRGNVQITYFESGLYRIGLQNSTAFDGVSLVQLSRNGSLLTRSQFLITQVDESDDGTLLSPMSNVSAVVNWNKRSFNDMIEIIMTGSYASTANFSYYSIEEEKCYNKAVLDSQLANTSLNNFQQSNTSSVLPYFMDINKTLSTETILRNANTSEISTTTLQFAQGYMYGVCVNRVTLNSFFTQINQGWTGFVFNELFQIFTENSTTPDVVQTEDDQNKTEEPPLILMPTGCSKMKIVNISLMQYECQLCEQKYILNSLFTSTLQQPLNKSTTPPKCICQMGYFMNETGLCTQCTSHPTNCKPQTKIQASLQSKFQARLSLSETRSFIITLQIINDRYEYSLMGDFEKVYELAVVYVNGVNYTVQKESFRNCTKEKVLENSVLCVNMRVQNVKKASQYMISVGTSIIPTGDILDSYLLINQTQSLTPQSTSQPSTYLKVASNSTNPSLHVSKLYFSKLQTYEVTVSQPFTAQKVVSTIQPLVETLNYSSSVVMIAAPFLMDKINVYSLLQTNSLLYMMTFLKFTDESYEGESEIQTVAKLLFIFRPEQFFKPFSVKSKSVSSSGDGSYIQLPNYSTEFESDAIYNRTLSNTLGYAQTLYKQAIPSLSNDNGSQNYMTLTLNALVNMGVQILLMELFMFLAIFFCSTVIEKKPCTQGEQTTETIKKNVQYEIKRHRYVNLLEEAVNKTWDYKKILKSKQDFKLIMQKPIQWLSMPEMKQCEKITIVDDFSQNKKQQTMSNQLRQSSQNKQKSFIIEQQQQQPSLKHYIIFFTTGFKQKRLIFYSSFIMIQLISQSYLLYFQLVKPLDVTPDDTGLNVLSYVDMMFGMGLMFLVIVFPVFLINYDPLHTLKIVGIVGKLCGYKLKKQKYSLAEKDNERNVELQANKSLAISYTYEEIYFDFCLIYYEIILIPFSIALGSNIFYQSLPITFYQVFKLIWMYKKLKILQTIKIITLSLIFALSGSWNFIENQQFNEKVLTNLIIWGMYIVLFIELAKLFKFLVVFLIKTLRLKIQPKQSTEKEQSQKSKRLTKSRASQNHVSILAEEEQPNFKLVKQVSELHEFDSEQHMIQKKSSIEKKKQKLNTLKEKSNVLNEIAKVRQNLRENLQYMRNRRKQVNEEIGK